MEAALSKLRRWLADTICDLRCWRCSRMIRLSRMAGDYDGALRWQRRLEHIAGWDE